MRDNQCRPRSIITIAIFLARTGIAVAVVDGQVPYAFSYSVLVGLWVSMLLGDSQPFEHAQRREILSGALPESAFEEMIQKYLKK